VESKITRKGQMTLPKEAREHLKVKPGDKVKIFIQPDGHVVLLPVRPITALKGIVKSKRRRPPTIEEMDEAVRDEAVARYRRTAGK
jgi:AbrB family looped-hinge helix DNA binding protein